MFDKKYVTERIHEYYWKDDINCATTCLKILSGIFSVKLHSQIIDAAVGMHGAGGYGAQCGLVEGTVMFMGIYGRSNRISDVEITGFCREFARGFNKKFGSLKCSELRPEGFSENQPPHLCEKLTCEAVLYNISKIRSKFGI